MEISTKLKCKLLLNCYFVKLHNNLASKALDCQAFVDSVAMRKILAQGVELRY